MPGAQYPNGRTLERIVCNRLMSLGPAFCSLIGHHDGDGISLHNFYALLWDSVRILARNDGHSSRLRRLTGSQSSIHNIVYPSAHESQVAEAVCLFGRRRTEKGRSSCSVLCCAPTLWLALSSLHSSHATRTPLARQLTHLVKFPGVTAPSRVRLSNVTCPISPLGQQGS